MLVEDDEPSYGKSWRHLIWKIYEVDPLRCPECGGELELIKRTALPCSTLSKSQKNKTPNFSIYFGVGRWYKLSA